MPAQCASMSGSRPLEEVREVTAGLPRSAWPWETAAAGSAFSLPRRFVAQVTVTGRVSGTETVLGAAFVCAGVFLRQCGRQSSTKRLDSWIEDRKQEYFNVLPPS